MKTIYSNRAVYQGRKQIVVLKSGFVNGTKQIIPDILQIFYERQEPGVYREGSRYFKDVFIKDLDEYYSLRYSGIYKGYEFEIDRVCYADKTVRIFTGDSFDTKRREEFRKIGIEGIHFERGMIYFKAVSIHDLDKITRGHYCRLTNQRTVQTISADELWAELLEARAFVES